MKAFRFVWLAGAVSCTLLTGGRAAFPTLPGLDKLNELQKDAGSKFQKVQKGADQAGKVAKGVTGLSLDEELAIGDAVSIAIVNRYGGLWRDAGATHRVNLLGRVLARYATRQDLDWRFGLLASDAVNAFSAPGGRVFITRGLYQLAANDNELAGVLGHEIEHIDRRHAVKIIARGEMLAGLSDVLSDRSKNFAKYEELINLITNDLLENGFDPMTEYEADLQGRKLAQTTGFAPGGLRVVLETLQKGTDARSGNTFSTHPPLAERLKRLPKDPAPPAPAAAPAPNEPTPATPATAPVPAAKDPPDKKAK